MRLWHSACLRSMPRTTMTLNISLLHTFLQMWCWSWYGVTHYSVCLKSMQRTIKMHCLTYMLSVLQRHNLIWRVDRHTNWWRVWKLELLWDPPRGITVPLFPWNNRLVSLFPKNRKLFSYVPCSPILPLYPVPLKIWPLFPVPLE